MHKFRVSSDPSGTLGSRAENVPAGCRKARRPVQEHLEGDPCALVPLQAYPFFPVQAFLPRLKTNPGAWDPLKASPSSRVHPLLHPEFLQVWEQAQVLEAVANLSPAQSDDL